MSTLFPDFLQNIVKWLPSYHFGSGAREVVLGSSSEWQSFLILGGYLIAFILLATYIRRKQDEI